ncbi:MAG: carbamoyl-phosphate synthase large subunit [Desulfocapsa sp.]|nr:carbamoyl-phosphate synthase large subunit [Desulfocapsa sp.]
MPKRTDIQKIMLIGSGPIIIGQACEFDYSGVQACKALKEEGYEVVLVNSNPATIMTDPEFAHRTYIEPLRADIIEAIIAREKPDALLPTLGGQTALNLSLDLADRGVLKQHGVELLGANAPSIRKAEDRQLFKEAMANIGLDLPRSGTAHTFEEAVQIKEQLDVWPLVIRPGFTLGGTGGGIAYNEQDFKEIVIRGLFYSPTSEVLVEESIQGWKEFELEVMRDVKDNCMIVCSIENLDPMGVHTGDSITVAPIQTLTDREYQIMRDAALAVMREIGVETGGSNVQFALNPKNGKMVIIEMNPRVSRSSALASKATGFPIAKIAAKLAVGYTLDELRNDITRETPACFEPTLDYVVTKIPRFTFEKFPTADDTLGTQMKSVGETMSIGKTFKQSLQKALRSLETGRAGFGADGKDKPFEELSDEELEKQLRIAKPDRIFLIRAAFKRGWSMEKVHELCSVDFWFLGHFAELSAYEEEIRNTGSLTTLAQDQPLFRQAKEFGYSDIQIAYLLHDTEEKVRQARMECGLLPVFSRVDTCAAEFAAHTPYFYSSYGEINESIATDRKKIMIIGGGPNRIGQGIEFDYCCVHGSYALQGAGFETIMVNSNPETVSTDYDTSDRLYFEPLTLEDILHIYRNEKCDGVIVQFGGQTPLNLARDLEQNGVTIIGTRPADIEAAEDRDFFSKLVKKLGIRQPENGMASTIDKAKAIASGIGYPVLMRPSFVLGGRAMLIVHDEKMLTTYMADTVEVSEHRPVLIDRYLEAAVEVDVDCISDGKTTVVAAVMEHIEHAGAHSGDSACMIPAVSLSAQVAETIKNHAHALAKGLRVCGLMNIQFAIQNEEVYVLEVNPRASRTVPFVSKAIGVPLAKLAALVMAGHSLAELGFTEEITPVHCSVKEAVFPFSRFPGIDVQLSPEMKSTGEVMGIDSSMALAFHKSQLAAGNIIPSSGNIFLSIRNRDKAAMIPLAGRLFSMGFSIYATSGTSSILADHSIPSLSVAKIADDSPNILDLIEEQQVDWLINIPTGATTTRIDGVTMRSRAVMRGLPITTTLSGMQAAVNGLETLKEKSLTVCSLQEYHINAPQINLPGGTTA